MKLVSLTGASRGLGGELRALIATERSSLVTIGRGDSSAGQSHISIDLRSFADPALWDESLDPLAALARDADGLVFVSCAGTIGPIGGPDEATPAAIVEAISVNLTAPIAIARRLTAIAREHSLPLSIVNISSGAAERPIGGWMAYCATKAGARMAFDALALSYPGIVTVAHVDPGALDGPMQDEIRRSDNASFPDRERFVRWHDDGTLRDPAAAAREIFDAHLAPLL